MMELDRLASKVRRWLITAFLAGYGLGFLVCWWLLVRNR